MTTFVAGKHMATFVAGIRFDRAEEDEAMGNVVGNVREPMSPSGGILPPEQDQCGEAIGC